jgi:hypothetical protein
MSIAMKVRWIKYNRQMIEVVLQFLLIKEIDDLESKIYDKLHQRNNSSQASSSYDDDILECSRNKI